MFDSKNAMNGVRHLEGVLWGGSLYPEDAPSPTSVMGRVNDLWEWRANHKAPFADLKNLMCGDDGRRISHIGMFGSVSYQTVPEYRTPPLETRLKAIEEALGLTYEYKDSEPAKWVTKKAKKR